MSDELPQRTHTTVASCADCPSAVYWRDGRYSCERMDYRRFEDLGEPSYVPPEWCPLPMLPAPDTAAIKPDDGGLSALVTSCANAVIAGQRTVTISVTGKRPAGFPRGELLSANQAGVSNYAADPIKALAWIHSEMKRSKPSIEATPAKETP